MGSFRRYRRGSCGGVFSRRPDRACGSILADPFRTSSRALKTPPLSAAPTEAVAVDAVDIPLARRAGQRAPKWVSRRNVPSEELSVPLLGIPRRYVLSPPQRVAHYKQY